MRDLTFVAIAAVTAHHKLREQQAEPQLRSRRGAPCSHAPGRCVYRACRTRARRAPLPRHVPWARRGQMRCSLQVDLSARAYGTVLLQQPTAGYNIEPTPAVIPRAASRSRMDSGTMIRECRGRRTVVRHRAVSRIAAGGRPRTMGEGTVRFVHGRILDALSVHFAFLTLAWQCWLT